MAEISERRLAEVERAAAVATGAIAEIRREPDPQDMRTIVRRLGNAAMFIQMAAREMQSEVDAKTLAANRK